MRDVLEHRGPDGAGECEIRTEDSALEGWLGHRRLKIIDLSHKADQPMANEDGSVVLTYNGEVYNFRELRRELEARGHVFRSTGDTEVVLRAYEAWGEDFVTRLDGMFALALWDAQAGKLLLARDRTGKKPLFWSTAGGRLAFGSEIKSLLACPWIEPEPDWACLPELLVFGYVPHPGTMYRGIRQVPPASVLVYDRRGVQPPQPYWDPLPSDPQLRPGPKVYEQIAELMRAATRRRLVSDVPLGAFLSGGIDSSLVVGLMSEAATDPVHTFSIGFPEDPSFDERTHARRVATHFDTRHTEFAVEIDAAALIDRLIWHHDQPFADSSAIPTYLVSQLAREHVTVVLNGDGGDEVFGGYERFTAAALSRPVPAGVAAVAQRAARLLPLNQGYYSVRLRAERFLELADAPTKVRYQSWISIFKPDFLYGLVSPRIRADGRSPTGSMDAQYERARQLPLLDQILLANFATYLPNDLAVKMDRMSMAHSLETRSPFLDTALIEYAARLPARHKVGLRRLKPVLRRAFHPLLPPGVWDRRKHGFGVPVGRWFRGELGVMFGDEVLGTDSRCAQVLDRGVMQCLFDEHRNGEGEHGARLWTLLTLERWLRGLDGPANPQPPSASGMSDVAGGPGGAQTPKPAGARLRRERGT